MKYTDKQIRNLLTAVYDGTVTVNKLPKDLYLAIGKHLVNGVYKGYGSELIDIDFGTTDYELLSELRNNTYMFSGAKTYQQVREFSYLASKHKTFSEFKKEALQTYEQYNVNWLNAEYNTCVGQAQQAKQWNDIMEDVETFPYLRYRAVMDKNTSDICRPLDGVTLPVNNAFWNKYTPLNHFNCRCIIEKIDKYERVRLTADTKVKTLTAQMDKDVQPEFKMNSGKDGYVFSKKHPYFEVAPKDKKLAKKNFNLPIPKND